MADKEAKVFVNQVRQYK